MVGLSMKSTRGAWISGSDTLGVTQISYFPAWGRSPCSLPQFPHL